MFFNEFSFFMVLPHLAKLDGISALLVGSLFTYAVVAESILMIFLSAWLNKIRIRTLYFIAPLLFVLAYASLIALDGYTSFLSFFSLMSLAKALGKPFSRTALRMVANDNEKDRIFINISLAQNSAIVLAPLAGMLTLGSKQYTYIVMLVCYLMIALSAIRIFKSTNISIAGSGESILIGFGNILTKPIFIRYAIGILLCYLIMGVFITGAVSSGSYAKDLESYVGALFSTVGITICIWQFFLSKTKIGAWITESKLFLLSTVFLSALFFIGNIYLSFLAIMAYGLFESILIPHCYKGGADGIDAKYHNQAFAVLLVFANLGEAVGSFVTGFAITNIPQIANYVLTFLVGMLGLLIVSSTYNKKD